MTSRNVFIINNGIVTAITTRNKFFIFDLEDLCRVEMFTWFIDSFGYASAHINNKTIRFHRYILDYPIGYVDHINKQKPDNRRCNLRVCTNAENCRNSSLSKNNTSGFKGIQWDSDRSLWHSRITVNRKQKFLGRFSILEDAIKARLQAEALYFGEFAPQKHLFSDFGVGLTKP